MEERAVPEVVKARRPDYEQQAREALGMSSEWKIMRWEAKGKFPNYYGILVTGAVPGPLKTRGKYKGMPDWSKRTMEASITLTNEAQKAWILAWERDTGFCSQCHGTGQKLKSWTRDAGASYVPCPRCDATGLSSAIKEAA